MKIYLSPIDGRKSFYGKAVVSVENGRKVLRSYDTNVCAIEGGRVTLLPLWDCSATTLRHVKAFLESNGFSAPSKAEIRRLYA